VKTVTFLLLFANLGFFAWIYFGAGRASDEPQLMEQQLNPQAIRLLRADQLAALGAERNEADGRTPQTASQGDSRRMPRARRFQPRVDAARVQQALEPLALGSRLSQRRVEEIASYWYSCAPAQSQAANQKAAELKKLGVEDFYVMQEDSKFDLRFLWACLKPKRRRGRGSRNCARRAFERPGSIPGKHPCRKSTSAFVRSPMRWFQD